MDEERNSESGLASALRVERLAELLSPDGAVGRALPGFEGRPEQQTMLEAVVGAFSRQRILLVEAGTGVGKSLAYGLPAALFALETGQRVVISTGTINLQEQLVGKDLPLVSRALEGELRVVLVKGRSNYLCQRRLGDKLRQRLLLEPDDGLALFETLAEWSTHTSDGSRSDLELTVPEQVWEQVCSDPDACLGRHCSVRDDCFFARARRLAERAHLLVVNHHLLFADLALRAQLGDWSQRAVLPAFERVIVDEGHTLEDVASGFFGLQLSRSGLLRTLGRLAPARSVKAVGLLAELHAEMSALSGGRGPVQAFDADPLVRLVGETRQVFERAFDALSDFAERQVAASSQGERRLRLTDELYAKTRWTAVHQAFADAASRAERLAAQLERLGERSRTLSEESGPAAEVRSSARRCAAVAQTCRAWIDQQPDDNVRWVELPVRAGGRLVKLVAAPLSVSDRLSETLFEQMRTAVITSATLAVGGSFGFLKQRLGADRQDAERCFCLQLESPFDHRSQARLVVVTDAPAPTDPAFKDWLPDAVVRLTAVSRGGTLVLFTARGLMTSAFELAHDRLRALGVEPLCQGHAPRDKLLRHFRQNDPSVLFGTDSFWQGVDVIGPALRQVIIARLPFDVPSEPLLEARAERIAAAGKSPFVELSLPRAVLKLKQGFGRLIRSRKDRGAVVVLDRRIVTKSYGRRFISSLPPAGKLIGPLDEICDRLAGFYHQVG